MISMTSTKLMDESEVLRLYLLNGGHVSQIEKILSAPSTTPQYPQFGSAVLHSGQAQPGKVLAFPLLAVKWQSTLEAN